MSASPAVTTTFAALADDTRRRAVEVLARAPLSAGELARELDVPAPVLTRHLRVLRQGGLVRVDLDPNDNRRHIYTLISAPVEGVREWAEDVASFWDHQLEAFAKHVAGAPTTGTSSD